MNSEGIEAQSMCEASNENTSDNDSTESQDKENMSEKWDLNEKLHTENASDVTTNPSVKKQCKNCGHAIQQDQLFCDKCGDKLGDVCCGEINGKPCSKFISVETKFCAHCGTANIVINSGNIISSTKISCKNCGHGLQKAQKFCDNCGFKIGAPCCGKINGSSCTEFLNVEIKFCANCGTANPDNLAAHLQSQNKDEISSLLSEDSIILLMSRGYTRDQAINALKCYGGHTEEAIDWLLSHPKDNDTTKRSKPPSDEDGMKRTKPPTDEDTMIKMAVPIDEHRVTQTKLPTDDDTITSTNPPTDEEKKKRKQPSTDDDTIQRLKPPTNDKTLNNKEHTTVDDEMKRTKLPTDEDTFKKMRPPSINAPMKRTNPPAQDRMTRTKPLTEDEAMKKSKPKNNDETIKRMQPPTDPDRIKISKPPTDDKTLESKEHTTVDHEMKRTKLPTDEVTIKKTTLPTIDASIKRRNSSTHDRMTRTKPLTDDTMKKTKPLTDDDTMTKTKPLTYDDAMKKTKLKTNDDTTKRTESWNNDESMTKTKPSTNEERTTKTTLLSDGGTLKGTKTTSDGDKMTRMNPSTDDYKSTRTKTALNEGQVHQQCQEQISVTPSHESVIELTSMGFTEKRAKEALTCSNGDQEEAIKLLLSSVKDYNMTQMKAALDEMDEDIKDSDEEKVLEFFAAAMDISLETTDEAFVEIESRGNIEKDILKRLETDGVIATAKFLMLQAMKWKRAKVKIAVAGQSSSGKSAFINAIRGVNYEDEGYAKEGFGDTTLEVKTYPHPRFKQMIYCDLPGYGTTTITREKFLEKVNIRDYDMFIVFFSCVPTPDDEWLVRQLQEANIPFCFVRTKLDQDIESGKRMGKNENIVYNDIIEAIAKSTKSMPVLKDEQVFIISNHKPFIGDMPKLVKFMQQKVTTVKFEAILYSIPAFTEEIIEKKYQFLLDRVSHVAYLHAMYFDNLRTMEVEIQFKQLNYDFHEILRYDKNIVNEIMMYFKVFELDSANGVPGIKHRFTEEHLLSIFKKLKDEMPGILWDLVPIYSVIKKTRICKTYLTNLLAELKLDAHTMYMYVTKRL